MRIKYIGPLKDRGGVCYTMAGYLSTSMAYQHPHGAVRLIDDHWIDCRLPANDLVAVDVAG